MYMLIIVRTPSINRQISTKIKFRAKQNGGVTFFDFIYFFIDFKVRNGHFRWKLISGGIFSAFIWKTLRYGESKIEDSVRNRVFGVE